MSRPLLLIGNKNYSSWSLRPWLFLKQHGIDFEERRVALYAPGSKEEILRHSPAGKVPTLIDDGVTVWDSLAILEYLNERHPQHNGWPIEPAARARARSVCAEMHSGFGALRQALPMNCRTHYPARVWPEDVQRDIERVLAIWSDCRARDGAGGPFLFGRFSIADAMYAPVVWRFIGFSVLLSEVAQQYCDMMAALPAMREWQREARAEVEVLEQFERPL
ncbi:MAG TPA: glutathione S-transferase family protein [Burkholderiales bacterium]